MTVLEKDQRFTKITLDEEGVTFPIVERELNGVVVDRKVVFPADLLKNFIDSADKWMLYDALMRRSHTYFNPVEDMFNYLADHDGEVRDSLRTSLMEAIVSNSNAALNAELLCCLCERVNAAELDAKAYNSVLKGMLAGIDKVVDSHELLAMTTHLLAKIDLFDKPDMQVLQMILDALTTHVRSELVRTRVGEMWGFLSARVSKSTVLATAADMLEDLELVSPILPRSCVFFRDSKKKTLVAIEQERSRWDVNLGGEVIPNVGHPHLLYLFHHTKEQSKVDAYVFAVKDTVIKNETVLYHYPFSNVNDDGKICWPNRPGIEHMRQLETFPDMFMAGERNFHLYPKTGGLEYRELLNQLSGNDFDNDLLEPTKYQMNHFLQKGSL